MGPTVPESALASPRHFARQRDFVDSPAPDAPYIWCVRVHDVAGES
jgi:hypothetical protein